jgi:hypothetical protein
MKKILLTICTIVYAIANSNAANYVFDLRGTGTNYLKTTNAPLSGNAAYTIEFWFNNNNASYTNYNRLIGFDNYVFELGLNNGVLAFYDGAGWRATTSANLNTGWHHVAVTNDLTNVIVYVDGAQVLTRANNANNNFSSNKMYIGINQLLDSPMKIQYDEVRVWNAAKTLNEINTNRVKQLIGNETNLIAYYASKETGNTSDLSSSNNTLIATGTINRTIVDFGLYLNDYSLNFDGTDDKAEVTSPFSSNSDFTLEAQFKIDANAPTNFSRIFSWGNFAFEVAITNGTLTTYKESWMNTTATGLNDEQWHHVAVSRAGSAVTIYVDGKSVGQRTISAIDFANSNFMYIGANSGSGDCFKGNIDEVRVWNVSSTQSDIIARMNTVDQVQAQGLAAYYDFNRPAQTVKSLLIGGTALTRTGASGTNNLPPFVVQANKTITPAILTTTGNSRCGTGSVTLQAAATAGTINWFADQSGGSALGTGTSFNSPSISSNTTYYAQAINNSVSSARVPVDAIVNASPTITSNTPANRCGYGTLTLTAVPSSGTVKWYTASTGGASISSGNSFTTPSITSTATYYADVLDNNNCTAASRTSIVATIKTIPTIANIIQDSRCGIGTVALGATATSGTVNWYAANTGGSSLATGVSYTTPSIADTTTYYVDATLNGCTTTTRMPVTAYVTVPNVALSTSGNTISVAQPGAMYQWKNCTNNTIIPNAVNQDYTATALGNYKVIITLNGCVDSSACENISVLGINGISPNNQLKLYPNPSNGNFTIEALQAGQYSIINELGQLVKSITLTNANFVQIEQLNPGIYFIIGVDKNNTTTRQKIIVAQ